MKIIIISKNFTKAEQYCINNGISLDDVQIMMFFDYYGSFLNTNSDSKIMIHDIDSKIIFQINDIERMACN